MSTFRDAIAQAINDTVWAELEPTPENLTEADAVLAMPEMQAIRKTLQALIAIHGLSPTHPYARTWLTARTDLHKSVIDWVLDGDT